MDFLFRLVITLSTVQFAVSQRECFQGTFYSPIPGSTEIMCELCPPDTFMPLKSHTNGKCFDCLKIANSTLEIMIKPCNRTHDSVIHCVERYYRYLARNHIDKDHCKMCTNCEFPVKSCGVNKDALCCPGENYDFIVNGDGVEVCRKRPWLCKRGHYYDPASSMCLPCPDGTFMHQDYHSFTECWKCQSPLGPLNSEIASTCNKTHPPVLECKEGFSINEAMGHGNDDIGCLRDTKSSTTEKSTTDPATTTANSTKTTVSEVPGSTTSMIPCHPCSDSWRRAGIAFIVLFCILALINITVLVIVFIGKRRRKDYKN